MRVTAITPVGSFVSTDFPESEKEDITQMIYNAMKGELAFVQFPSADKEKIVFIPGTVLANTVLTVSVDSPPQS